MALTELGFTRRTYDEILTDKIERAKDLFGEDIDTSELTPLGKYIRINAYDQALTEEEAEKIYYSIFPNTATGISLDRLCTFIGLTRNPATPAKYTVTVEGTAGAIVPQGFLVGTDSEITYANNSDVTIADDGTAILEVDCTEVGEIGNVNTIDITTIVNPSADVNRILSVEIMEYGAEVESDYSLRKRFAVARDGLGSCNEASIVAAIMRIDTVESAGIITNEEDHSFECFVDGGIDHHAEIAQAIFDKKPIGIKTTGQESFNVEDASGGTYTVHFSHTGEIKVWVNIKIKTNALFEGAEGEREIQSNITSYIDTLGIGGKVILSALYGEIHKVTGVTEVVGLTCSTDGSVWSTNNIEPQQYEKCVCVSVAIEVIE